MLPMQGRRVVIFGATGQDGHYLAQSCLRRGAEVHGYSRRTAPACDVSDFAAVEAVFRRLRPDYAFHLAAESRTAHEALFLNHAAIAGGAVNILEAALRHAPQARVLIAGSGLQFVNTGAPIHESAPFEAGSPYAAARIYAACLARYYRARMGLASYVAYLFHHESPLRGARHTSRMIAEAAARAGRGGDGSLLMGDLSVEKEWSFAGDIAEAMLGLVLQDEVSECVIGSGEGRTIGQWAQACFAAAGLDWRDFVRQKNGFTPEYARLVSDPRTIRRLGWAPALGFEALAKRMVEACGEPARE